jgi:plasmid stabilization system protein ParE
VFKVIVSPKAWEDFFQIHDYIAADDPDAAARFCEGLLNHIELLGTFPRIGSATPGLAGVRSVLHTPVRIYYRVDEQRLGVEIIHFWHTARRSPPAQ